MLIPSPTPSARSRARALDLVLVLVLVLDPGALPAAQGAPSPSATTGRTAPAPALPDPPRGYVLVEQSGWAWAVPRGSRPPSEGLTALVTDRLHTMRMRLGRTGTLAPLVVRTANRAEFRRVTQELGGGDPEDFVPALAFPTRGIVVYDAERLRAQLLRRGEVLAHEVAHVVMGEAGPLVPRWYHEGVAQWLAGERVAPEMPRLIRRLAHQESLYPFAHLRNFPPESQRSTSIYYAQALLFIVHLNQRFGTDVHPRILDHVARGNDLGTAFAAVTGLPLQDVETEWHARLAAEHSWTSWLLTGGSFYQLLALIAVIAFFFERRRRLRALARMAALEEGVPVDPRSYGGELPPAPPVGGVAGEQDRTDEPPPSPRGDPR